MAEASRVCWKCGETKVLEDFPRRKGAKDDRDTRCKACNAAAKRAWYAINAERARAASRAWYDENADSVRANHSANRERINRTRRARWDRETSAEREARMGAARIRNKRYAEKNRAKLAEKNRAWWLAQDPEHHRERQRQWKARNRDKVAADNHRRRRREGVLTTDDREYIKILYRDPCSYCGAPVREIDHIEPLVEDGDLGWENLTGACTRCNRRKHTHSLLAFLAFNEIEMARG